MGEIEALVILMQHMGFPLWSCVLTIAVIVMLKIGFLGVIRSLDSFSKTVELIVKANTEEQVALQKSNRDLIEVTRAHATDTKNGIIRVDDKLTQLLAFYVPTREGGG